MDNPAVIALAPGIKNLSPDFLPVLARSPAAPTISSAEFVTPFGIAGVVGLTFTLAPALCSFCLAVIASGVDPL